MDLRDEYLKIKTSVGLFDLSSKGKIRVDGNDRIDFLHNILSNDIQSLPIGSKCFSALLSATGKVLAMMEVLIYHDYVLLITESGFAKQTMERLSKFIIIEDVQLLDVTNDFDLFSIEGPTSDHSLQLIRRSEKTPSLRALPPMQQHRKAVFKETPSLRDVEADESKQSKERLLQPKTSQGFAMTEGSETPITIIHHPFIMTQGFALLGAGGSLKSAAAQLPLEVSSNEVQEILRIENGQLRYGVDITDDMLLPETGLEDLYASETKGCYPGQEVVAKIKTYGRLNRKIVKLIFEGGKLPLPGEIIFSGEKEAGRITSACFLPDTKNKGIALGLLKRHFFEEKELYPHLQLSNGVCLVHSFKD
ncbi:MAG: hypothetical protein H6757_04150 [Candidatus Omnitrophica bacterium]|nr:hypothetical protein [Candidatus Omnitrophota bacterium]